MMALTPLLVRSYLSRTMRLGALVVPCVAGALPAHAQQPVSVSGIVTEAGQGTPIGDATVSLAGRDATTGRDGRFRIEAVTPGRYSLEVVGIGYRRSIIDLEIRNDTVIQIVLEPDPLALETLIARAVTIRGTLRDAETGRMLEGGQVILQPGDHTTRVPRGDFRFDGVAAGRVTISARVIEYLPARIDLDAIADTTLRIDMEVDSVGLRLVARLVHRLAERAEELPLRVRALGRDDIRSSGAPTVAAVIRRELPLTMKELEERCVMYDDRRIDPNLLLGIPSDIIERVEIIGYGGAMIRVYSKRYVLSLMRRTTLPKMQYLRSGLGRVCF